MGALVVIALFASRGRLNSFVHEPQVLPLLVCAFVVLLTPWTVSQVKPMFVAGRYTILPLIPFALIVGLLIARFAPRPVAVAGALVLASSALVHCLAREPGHPNQAAADVLSLRAADDDIVVFTSLSQAVLQYHLRHVDTPRRFVWLSFPPSTQRHRGWIDVAALERDPDGLERDAEQLAVQLDALMNEPPQRSVWLVDGYSPRLDEAVRGALGRHLVEVHHDPFHGSFFEELSQYQRASP
jgi:hypothetical protein